MCLLEKSDSLHLAIKSLRCDKAIFGEKALKVQHFVINGPCTQYKHAFCHIAPFLYHIFTLLLHLSYQCHNRVTVS